MWHDFLEAVVDTRLAEIQLDGCGSDAATRVKNDIDGDLFNKALRGRSEIVLKSDALREKLDALHSNNPCDDIACDDKDAVMARPADSVRVLPWQPFMSIVTADGIVSMLSDMVSHRCTHFSVKLTSGTAACSSSSKGLMVSNEGNWKKDLPDDPTLVAVVSVAQETMKKLSWKDLKPALNQLQEDLPESSVCV